VANLGDSRALLWRPGPTLEVTRDHRPGDAAERARIEAAGGTVSEEDGRGQVTWGNSVAGMIYK